MVTEEEEGMASGPTCLQSLPVPSRECVERLELYDTSMMAPVTLHAFRHIYRKN